MPPKKIDHAVAQRYQTLIDTYTHQATAWLKLNGGCSANSQHVARVPQLLELARTKLYSDTADARQLIGLAQGILLTAGVRPWERLAHDEDNL